MKYGVAVATYILGWILVLRGAIVCGRWLALKGDESTLFLITSLIGSLVGVLLVTATGPRVFARRSY